MVSNRDIVRACWALHAALPAPERPEPGTPIGDAVDRLIRAAVEVERLLDDEAEALGLEMEEAARDEEADPWERPIREFLAARADASWRAAIGELQEGEEEVPADRVHSLELFRAVGKRGGREEQAAARRVRRLMEHVMGWRYCRSLRIGDRVTTGYVPGPNARGRPPQLGHDKGTASGE